MLPFLNREHSVAGPGFSRWLVPPAALAIHLSIGQVYAFSVFKNPLLALKAADGSLWTQKEIGYIFSIAIAVLGLSAALLGKWLEAAGPRKAMFVSASCFGLGFLVAAAGVEAHSLALIYFGYGVIGGVGLGIGYISPVSTLIRWFPDRPGLATGLAIMGFGGGAMIGSPLGTKLMALYKASGHQPIAAAWITMGILYFVFMMFGVFTVRVPRKNWKPAGWTPKPNRSALMSAHNVDVNAAFKTPQFWLLWIVLCTNVTAGIAIIEQASPMIQELFKGRITAVAAGGFVALLSLFNMGGRFVWSSVSDYIGRKNTYYVFFVLGAILYYLAPSTGASGLNNIKLFVTICAVILTMYGGGFATIPAYLRDLFGTMEVGAIHGRLLTAWSAAGVFGPVLVNYIREYEKGKGVALADAYSTVLYVMVGLLIVGFLANAAVRPVDSKHWYKSEEVDKSLAAVPGSAVATR